ncbi:MAG TPA: MlaD family protein [Verrucomicrobiae bacterium]|nr:MlaD family protein [Verrucomicrobiae bacterium]
MSKSRTELKVGFFVLICLTLVAVLLLQFSKGVTLFRKTYTIILNTSNVGGLKPRAQVLMSGVMVGTVSKTVLSPQGTNVAVYLKMYSQYVVPTNSTFKIEQSGFLGDQYVAIYPVANQGEVLTDGAEVHANEPFNIQEVAAKVNQVIDAVQHVVLNTNTLTNVAVALVHLKSASEKAEIAVDHLNALILSNSAPLTAAFSNLVTFSDQLDAVGTQAGGILETNRPKINLAMSNLYTASVMMTNLLSEVDHGNGLVAELLKDEELGGKVKEIAGGLSATSTNLAIATANLNRLGLWHFLWYHPKHQETNEPSRLPPVQQR